MSPGSLPPHYWILYTCCIYYCSSCYYYCWNYFYWILYTSVAVAVLQ